MPTLAKKPKTPGASGKLPDVQMETRPVVYPELTVNGVAVPVTKMQLPAAMLRQLLGWETEEDYKRRCEASKDLTERAKGINGFGEEFLLLDTKGRKVRCWNNLDNRPFDETTARKYAQDTLNLQWAGPHAFPGETVNGETIIISRTGKTQSGQHRGVGAILAAELWAENPKAYPLWTEEPFIESLVVFGVSDSPEIVRTLDNVRPRTLADTVYTSDVFKRTAEGKETGQKDRKELSRMLDAAIDLLWRRTSAGGGDEPARRYQTHSTSFDFLARHPRLQRAVKHLWECNSNRQISLLQLSPGQCAALLYLMGSARSDPDKPKTGYLATRDERALDWGLWDKAEEFFVLLADCGDRSFKAIKAALGKLKTIEDGLGGRQIEKVATLAAAWKLFEKGEEITEEDLALAYGVDRSGNPVLSDPPTCGGIDFGHDPTPAEQKATPKEVEAAKREVREQKAKDAINTVAGRGKKGGSALQALDDLRKDHPDCILLFPDDTGSAKAYGKDALVIAEEMVMTPVQGPGGVDLINIPQAAFEVTVKQMMAEGHRLKTVAYTDGAPTVTELRPRVGRGGPSLKPTARPTPAEAKVNGQQPKPAAPAPKAGGKKTPALRGGTGS